MKHLRALEAEAGKVMIISTIIGTENRPQSRVRMGRVLAILSLAAYGAISLTQDVAILLLDSTGQPLAAIDAIVRWFSG
jgi:hypothetical protein